MRIIFKVFFLNFAVLLISFPPLLSDQPESGFDFNGFEDIQAIIDDFLVNDDTAGGYGQTYPAVARDLAGNFVVTWMDYRNGNWDIYGQIHSSSGTHLGSNFKVNDDTGFAVQSSPAIAVDYFGNFVIVWQDGRSGKSHIYAQRYDFSGTPMSSNFKVNDDAGSNEIPSIAMNATGNFVITWKDSRWGTYDIYAQGYNSTGTPLGSNFRVNDDTGSTYQTSPAVAMNNSGDFVITWTDQRYSPYYNYYIYAQRYDSTGTPLGTNFKVNETTTSTYQEYPAIAMNNYGNFVITWQDFRNGPYNSDIYAQRYNSSGVPLDFNFRVNDDTVTTYQYSPAIVMDDSGNFIITWSDGRNGNYDIYVQRYDFFGAPLGFNFRVNDDTMTADQRVPSLAIDGSDNSVIVWTDFRNSAYPNNTDIYAQRYDSSNIPLGSNFKVNEDAGSTDQTLPDIAIDESGNFSITWMDLRNGWYSNGTWYNSDIYAQRYSSLGDLLGSNFKVNDDTANVIQNYPKIDMDGAGNYVITWQDYRNGNPDIYAQRYNPSGTLQDLNFKVNDDTGTVVQYYPAIGMDNSGNFIITWQDYRAGNGDIYGQMYSSTGVPIGLNFKVNDDAGTRDQHFPVVAMDSSGDFVIAWQDYRDAVFYLGYVWLDTRIYAQIYNSSGTPMGSNFRVGNITGVSLQESPAIAVGNSGSFVITWHVNHCYYPFPAPCLANNIYAQRYSINGTPFGSNFRVNDDTSSYSNFLAFPAAAMDASGNFVITWRDTRNNQDVYTQRFNSSGDILGNKYIVPNRRYISFAQTDPAVVANTSNIYFVWQDDHRSNWDIYAKVVDWNWTEVEEEQITGLPKSFELYQNYPNPFNPSTAIPFTVYGSQFRVRGSVHTTLKVYNILGQLVRTLVDEEKLAGNYNVIWNGKDVSGNDVASGIYFYQLKTKDFTDTRKMVLLR